MTSRTCAVEVIPDGPALLRGVDVVTDGEGQDHEVTRPVVAICLCGHTQRAPWCDGTHKAAQEAMRKSANQQKAAPIAQVTDGY
jgi:CDGSH-type Zn-finger protein